MLNVFVHLVRPPPQCAQGYGGAGQLTRVPAAPCGRQTRNAFPATLTARSDTPCCHLEPLEVSATSTDQLWALWRQRLLLQHSLLSTPRRRAGLAWKKFVTGTGDDSNGQGTLSQAVAKNGFDKLREQVYLCVWFCEPAFCVPAFFLTSCVLITTFARRS